MASWLDKEAAKLGVGLNKHISERDQAVLALVDALEKRLQRTLRALLKDVLSQDAATKQAAVNQLSSMAGIYESLLDAGLKQELDSITKLYGRELANVRSELKAVSPQLILTEFDVDAARTLLDYDLSSIEGVIRDKVSSLRSVVARSIVSGTVPDYVQLAEDYSGKIAANIETELNTGLSAFNQSITNAKAEQAGLTTFMYLGPDDKVTRPFCAMLIAGGRIYTKDEIEKMDNGQGLPVMETGGGWNCRHQWRPLTEKEAAKLMAGGE